MMKVSFTLTVAQRAYPHSIPYLITVWSPERTQRWLISSHLIHLCLDPTKSNIKNPVESIFSLYLFKEAMPFLSSAYGLWDAAAHHVPRQAGAHYHLRDSERESG